MAEFPPEAPWGEVNMDDLVERLRQIRGTQFTPIENALVAEAADRIEKLEAAMQDIAGPAANIDVAKAIARVALRATITSSAR